MFPISKEALLRELELAANVVEKWKSAIGEGYPGQDVPVEDQGSIDRWLSEFCGEMSLLSGKFESLSMIMLDGFRASR